MIDRVTRFVTPDGVQRAMTRPTDAAGLVAFRVGLGVLVTISALRFVVYGWVDELFVKPTWFFTYYGFSWVRPLSAGGMHGVFFALAALGVLFALGRAHRIVAPLAFALFAYVQLIDVTNWLNHYYLVSLLLLVSCFMPIGQADLRGGTAPAWCTYLLRFQVGVVYVFAGLAKLSTDWLVHAQPLNIWLSARSGMPLLGKIFEERWVAYAFSWGGFVFDTTVPLFLSFRRTRPFAYVVLVGFHVVVGALFPIGMFPWIMIVSALVFFPPSWPRVLLRRPTPIFASAPRRLPRWALPVMAAYCILQVAIPLRSHLYAGNVLWHEQGMRFSWRVMCREKNGSITYVVSSKSKGRTVYVEPRRYLTDRQEKELSSQPDLVLQLGHHVAEEFGKKGWSDVEVRADAFVSLNGRSAIPMVDPTVDLAAVEDGFATARWITPAPKGPPIHLRPTWGSVATR